MQDSCLAVNLIFKYSRQICSSKQMFSETSQNSQKNTCAGVYVFLKNTPTQVFSYEFNENFQSSFSSENRSLAAFEVVLPLLQLPLYFDCRQCIKSFVVLTNRTTC